MKFFYQISIYFYYCIVNIASIFNPKAKLWIDGRKNVFSILREKIKTGDKIIWFHCASLGEFEQGRPLLEKIKKEHPDFKVVVTFFSPSGFEVVKNYKEADCICYLPIDSSSNAKKFLDIVQPEMVFFVKYEFWYFFLNELNKRSISTYLVSAVFRKEQPFFKWYGGWYLNILNNFTHIFTQNKLSLELLKSYSINNTSYSGDTRFDRVFENSLQPKKMPIIEAFKQNKTIIIAGSSWETEEEIFATYINNSNQDVKFIIAPHEVKETHIFAIEKLLKRKSVRYSNATCDNVFSAQVLIVDNIGILANTYQYTDFAFIGGGFTGALHNILEPASFGNVLLFGPKHKKFTEAKDLIDFGGAIEVFDNLTFTDQINSLLLKDRFLKVGSQNKLFVVQNKGATEIVYKHVID